MLKRTMLAAALATLAMPALAQSPPGMPTDPTKAELDYYTNQVTQLEAIKQGDMLKQQLKGLDEHAQIEAIRRIRDDLEADVIRMRADEAKEAEAAKAKPPAPMPRPMSKPRAKPMALPHSEPIHPAVAPPHEPAPGVRR
jgi:hypothetical protein